MAFNLDFVKTYLRVDSDDDDEVIKLCMDTAKKYVKDAVGKCDNKDPRVKMLILNIVATLYENRQYTMQKMNDKVAYSLRTMILQLQLGGDDD